MSAQAGPLSDAGQPSQNGGLAPANTLRGAAPAQNQLRSSSPEITFAAGAGGTGRFGLRILGEKGAIDLLTGHLPDAYLLEDPLWSPGRSRKQWVPISSAGPGEPEPLTDRGLPGGNQLACQDLLSAIEEDRQPEANVYEARTTVEMISAIFDSHRQGLPVTIPLASRDNGLTKLNT